MTVHPPCSRCGESAFPVELLAPHISLCRDCIQWIGAGSLSGLTVEYLEWATVPDVTQLQPVYGTCYQRQVKQERAKTQKVKPASSFSGLNQLSERFARSSRGKA